MLRKLRSWVGQSPPRAEAAEATGRRPRPAPVEVSDETFVEVVLDADRPVVVDFWAEWCQPCTIMSAYMGFLLEEFGDRIVVAALDVEENATSASKYRIMGLPTLIIFKDGVEVDRQLGVVEYETLRERVANQLAPSQEEARTSAAAGQATTVTELE